MLKIGNFVLMNTDIEETPILEKGEKLISYGINSKSTFTFSSITDDKAVVSLQRGFRNAKGNEVEPQEIIVDTKGNNKDDILLNTAVGMILSADG